VWFLPKAVLSFLRELQRLMGLVWDCYGMSMGLWPWSSYGVSMDLRRGITIEMVQQSINMT
jgi:hypothetical protein